MPTLNPKTQKKLAMLGYSVDLISHTLTGWLAKNISKKNCFKHLIDAGQFLNRKECQQTEILPASKKLFSNSYIYYIGKVKVLLLYYKLA